VIGLTTTACAKYWDLLKTLGIKTVICEEAGEVMEAHTFNTLVPSIEHAIFIGDPLQLRYIYCTEVKQTLGLTNLQTSCQCNSTLARKRSE
jgi:hypothetical protein